MVRRAGGLLVGVVLSSLLLLLGGRLRSVSEEKGRGPVNMQHLANSGCTGRLAASMAVIGSFDLRLWQIRFKFGGEIRTSAAKVRLRARVVSPFEVFLVDVKPDAEANELYGRFTLGDHSLSRIDEVTVEVCINACPHSPAGPASHQRPAFARSLARPWFSRMNLTPRTSLVTSYWQMRYTITSCGRMICPLATRMTVPTPRVCQPCQPIVGSCATRSFPSRCVARGRLKSRLGARECPIGYGTRTLRRGMCRRRPPTRH